MAASMLRAVEVQVLSKMGDLNTGPKRGNEFESKVGLWERAAFFYWNRVGAG